MIRTLAFAVAFAPLALFAQSNAADILAALDEPTSELEQLGEILDGTNEEKALVAMRLMLASGDPVMKRLALRSGLTSTSGVMRGVALEAFFQGQPNLVAFAKSEEEDTTGFQRWMLRAGALSSENSGSFPVAIGPAIDGENCFSAPGYNECRNRVAGAEAAMIVVESWAIATLNDSGELVGTLSAARESTGPISFTIPLLGQLQ